MKIMKNSVIIYFLVLSTVCLACSKESEEKEQTLNDPRIKYLLPNTGSEGQDLTIVGSNFGSNSKDIIIEFGDRQLNPSSVSEEAISTVIPEFKGNEKVNVLVRVKERKTNSVDFLYLDNNEGNSNEFETKVTNTGHLVEGHVNEVRKLRGYGPYISLKDGGIATVTEGSSAISVSRDEGVTWTSYEVLPNDLYSFLSPHLTVTENGTIIVGFSNGKEIKRLNWNKATHSFDPDATLPTYTIRSLDGGRTWQNLIKLHSDWTGMNRDMLTMKNGDVVFATMRMFNNPGRHTVLTYTSKDDGVTWKASNILEQPGSPSGDHAGFMESTLEELADGRLWMLIRTNLDYLYDTFSSDQGLTWSTPKRTSIDASSSPAVLKRLQSGRLILVWNRVFPEGRSDYHRMSGDGNLAEIPASWQRDELSVMFSEDDGVTWTEPKIIAKNHIHAPSTPENAWDQTKWLSYPHLFEVKAGVIWLTTGHGGLKVEFKEENYITK